MPRIRRKHHGEDGLREDNLRETGLRENEMSEAENAREGQDNTEPEEAGSRLDPERDPAPGEGEMSESEPEWEDEPGDEMPEPPSIDDLDPASRGMQQPHQHGNQTGSKRQQRCYCGARRETGLMRSGAWTGGVEQETAWRRAHLLAVLRAVDTQEGLPELHTNAVIDLHTTLLRDPPGNATKSEDMDSLKIVYRMALGAAQRMMAWHLQNDGDE